MKFILFAWILMLWLQTFSGGAASRWFPLDVGNQWTYEHESREGSREHPFVTRWETVETVTGSLSILEGTVVLRQVQVKGKTSGGWLQSRYGESDYLIRKDCLYFLDPHDSWDEQGQRLRPDYQTRLLAGQVQPEFCFPLAVGQSFGRDLAPGWIPSRVVGRGKGGDFALASISERAFDVVSHLLAADETHFWFEKGIGVTGEWDRHNGTYGEYRVRLLRFQPAGSRGKRLSTMPQ